MTRRPAATTTYIGGVIFVGAVLLVTIAPQARGRPLLAAGLVCVSVVLALFKLRLPLSKGVATLAPTCAVDFIALLFAGVPLATVVAAVGVLIQCTVRVRQPQPAFKTAFSVASTVIAVQAAGWVWSALGGSIASPGVLATAIPLSATAVAYFLVQTLLVAGAIALTSARPALRAWHREFMWSAPSYFASAMVAGLVAVVVRYEGYAVAPFAAAPVVLSYLAYQMAVQRIDEERGHAQELAATLATTRAALAVAMETIRNGSGTGDPEAPVADRHGRKPGSGVGSPTLPDPPTFLPQSRD